MYDSSVSTRYVVNGWHQNKKGSGNPWLDSHISIDSDSYHNLAKRWVLLCRRYMFSESNTSIIIHYRCIHEMIWYCCQDVTVLTLPLTLIILVSTRTCEKQHTAHTCTYIPTEKNNDITPSCKVLLARLASYACLNKRIAIPWIGVINLWRSYSQMPARIRRKLLIAMPQPIFIKSDHNEIRRFQMKS